MAAPTRILTLDLGTQNIRLAEFQAGKDGSLILSKYDSRSLVADPSADASRLAQTGFSVSSMVSDHKLKGQKVNFTIPTSSVFSRFVKLPAISVDRVEEIVKFEAQQNVPYPIDDVVWDYQLIEQESSEVEVVLAAVKSDLLDEMNGAVEGAGLKTNVVDVSPFALYNAYRYNYGDTEGCTLLIDIGARTTNLIFIEHRKVFTRTLHQGGSKLTEAIAKDLAEPFATSEERKLRDGYISLGGNYMEPDDPEIGRVSKMIRSGMTRLHQEIVRSVSFYRSNQGGTAPQRVLLAGGSSSLPYAKEFFQEKFTNLTVDFFNPLRNVAVGAGLDLDEIGKAAHNMGELVGLALRSAARCPMELDLPPATVVNRQRLAVQRPAFILAAVCVLIALGAVWFWMNRSLQITREVTEQVKTKAAPLKRIEGDITSVRSKVKARNEFMAPLLMVVQERQFFTSLINEINAKMPGDFVWITDFSVSEEKVTAAPAAASASSGSSSRGGRGGRDAEPPKTSLVARISGLYLVNPREASVVDEFVANLKQSDMFAEVVTDPARGYVRETPNPELWASKWAVPLVLKDSMTLK